jgi:hypothetical protein
MQGWCDDARWGIFRTMWDISHHILTALVRGHRFSGWIEAPVDV